MLCRSSVLVVLDDVSDRKQLEALAGLHNWFGGGSRIIITTRDEHLLRAHKVDDVCHVKLLSDDEAIVLFNKHAFNEKEPIKDYGRLSSAVVSYAAGLPLALTVLGSFLYDKNEKEWTSALDRLKDNPEMEVVEKLKISYDGLKTEEKELFLDIACFFRRKSTNDAMEIFEACGFHPDIGIKVLRQKALITTENGNFDMHDLVQEMAHYIVRGNPENHSRVWSKEEIDNMCSADETTIKENYNIEAIPYRYECLSSRFCTFVSNMRRLRWLVVDVDEDEDEDEDEPDIITFLCDKIVSNMKKLRSLTAIMKDDHKHDAMPNFLSNELRYIYWKGYPTSPFPDSFQPTKLVVLKLNDSLQKELWKGCKHLPHLKVLQLNYMKNLVTTPDFDGLPCLQKLALDSCDELEVIQPSLGNHTSLEYVHVSWCPKLKKFPTIVHMEKLQNLKIRYCKACEFPEIQTNMGSLVELFLEHINIEVLPSSVGKHCTNLTSLYLNYCDNLKSIEFNLDALILLEEFICHHNERLQLFETVFPRSLWKLDLVNCGLEDGKPPSDIGELCNLQELNLGHNDFTRFDFSLSQLTQLICLILDHCFWLVELPELPSSVAIVKADGCLSLTVGDFHRNCKWLSEVSLLGVNIVNDGSRLLESMLQGKAIENGTMVLRLKGLEIAKGFTPPLRNGSICRLQLPENWSNDFCGFLLCAVCGGNSSLFDVKIRMRPSDKSTRTRPVLPLKRIKLGAHTRRNCDEVWEENVGGNNSDSDSDYDNRDTSTWVGYVPFDSLRHATWWDQTHNSVSFSISPPSSGFGVRLVARKSGSHRTETSTNSSETCDYTPRLRILHDSEYGLTISLHMYDYYSAF